MTLGETAGRYRIVGKIAAGGMGEVYRATMESVGGVEKTVALKVVKGQLARDPDFSALFVEEVKVAMTLSHANVVHAFDVGRIDDRWYLAMEHVDGVDLAELMHACERRIGQRIPHRYALFVVVEALKGLDYAHRRRGADGELLHIVHRDVSPGNILVSYEGEVKVADFGIAKSTLRSFGSMAGTVKGKIPYMAPEQLRGAPADRRADIYSVGAVLYELLLGRRVVDEEDATRAIPQVLEGEFPRPRQVEPSVGEELDRIVMRALAPQPEERFPSAAAMRQELEQLALREGYLLSSGDLADFVLEVLERDPVAAARASHASTTPRRASTGVPTAAAPETGALEDPAPEDGADPFDALLGAELEKVRTSEPFSVFTTSEEGQRLAPRTSAPRAPEDGDRGRSRADADAADPASTGTVPGFPSRRRRRRLGLVALLGLVAAGAAAAVVAATAERGEVVTAAAHSDGPGRSADHGPAGDGPPADPAESALPAGLEPPPVGFESANAGEAGAGTETEPGVEARRRRAGGRRAARDPARSAMRAARAEAPRAEAPRAEPPVPQPREAPATPAANAEPALLSVNTDPWSYVYVDGERLGPTPQLRKQLSPGRHRVRMHNPSEDLEREVVVELGAGDHRRITLDLRP